MKRILLILTACLMTSTGVLTLRHSHVLTGGTAGLSLSLTYLFHSSFAIIFFLINIPFYVFSHQNGHQIHPIYCICSHSADSVYKRGSLAAVCLFFTVCRGSLRRCADWVRLVAHVLSSGFARRRQYPCFISAKRYGWNPGTVNFLFDFGVVLVGIFSVGLLKGLFSLVSIAVTGLIVSFFKNKIKSSYSLKPALLQNITPGQSQEASS